MKESLIVANWKMNPSDSKEAISLAASVKRGVRGIKHVRVVLCPPFLFIPQLLAFGNVQIGAQDCSWEQKGAFTGEISPVMLKKIGCTYVIVGHSERKNYLAETPEMLNKKTRAVLKAGLIPIVCIGEKSKKRGGKNKTELETQMKAIISGLPRDEARRIVVAYEPEWAISSNKNAKAAEPEDCKNAVGYMRTVLARMYGKTTAQHIPILYGGSTTSRNVKGFLREGGAEGALVGSASLKTQEFVRLVRNAEMQ